MGKIKDKVLYDMSTQYHSEEMANDKLFKRKMNQFLNFWVDVIPFVSRNNSFNSYEHLKESIQNSLEKDVSILNEEKLKLQVNINYYSHANPYSVAALLLSFTAMCISLGDDFINTTNKVLFFSGGLLFLAGYIFLLLRYRKLTDKKLAYYKLKLECVEEAIKNAENGTQNKNVKAKRKK